MDNNKLTLINEQTSPLQRIMWVYNVDEPAKRIFENNICSFHIGNGYFLSVAHNLRSQTGYVRSIPEQIYLNELLPKLDGAQKMFLEQCYFTDNYTRKMHLNNYDPIHLDHITKILKQKRFDTRWVTLSKKKVCIPFLIFQFKDNTFYNDIGVTRMFDAKRQMMDTNAHKHTIFIEVELVKAFYGSDIALYKIVNTPEEIINKIPAVELNYDLLDSEQQRLYCVQSSPNSVAGRLVNDAKIEGILDHFGVFPDDIEGNYVFEGYRYLIKSYFRFGSSGAPYVFFDEQKGKYQVNAIQSEASGIQFSIKNDKEGNYQYVNAIASPLFIIKNELEQLLKGGDNNNYEQSGAVGIGVTL